MNSADKSAFLKIVLAPPEARRYIFCLSLLILTAAFARADFLTVNYAGAPTVLRSINDAGAVVGYFRDGTNHNHAFLQSGLSSIEFSYPGAAHTYFADINNLGQVIGHYFDGFVWSGFMLHGSTLEPIHYPGSTFTFAGGINNLNQIVGQYTIPCTVVHFCPGSFAGDVGFGYLRNGSQFSSYDPFGSTSVIPFRVNDYGDITGSYFDSAGHQHGFVGANSVFTSFDYPGAVQTFAAGINNSGEIVGFFVASDGSMHGFVRNDAAFEQIDYPGAGSGGTGAFAINNSGQIAGFYWDTNGIENGFVYSPSFAAVPEASSFVLCLLACLGVLSSSARNRVERRPDSPRRPAGPTKCDEPLTFGGRITARAHPSQRLRRR